ncbi:MAG: transglycosylase domain-containing protein [Aminipila sp.]
MNTMGLILKGLLRSGYQFFKTTGEETQGASTITQQLLKNTIFTDWTSEGDNIIKKIKRKLQEQYLALEISKILDKDEVLIRYMNTINLGQNTLGIEAASQRYFGKSVSELTLSECTVISSITQNPSRYNPITHPDYNAERRIRCLNKMLELEFITQSEYDTAMADDVYSRIEEHNTIYIAAEGTSSYFVDALTYDLKEDLLAAGYNETQVEFLLYSGGLRIQSTMDPKIQAIADEAAANPDNYPENIKWYLSHYALTVTGSDGQIRNYSKEMLQTFFKENYDKSFNLIFSSQEAVHEAIATYKEAILVEGDTYDETTDEKISMTPQPQISITIEDQETGYVVAMVGGRGDKEGRLTLNRATDAYRQPGSTFKILSTYAPALDSAGLTLATVLNDAPFNYDDGTPVSNWYDTGYRGLNSFRTGIEDSLNIIAVKALTLITPQLGYDYLLNFGFTSLTTSKTINGKIYSDVMQPLALGGITNGVSNIELNAAFASIANAGTYVKPKLYTKVLDADGNVILDNTTVDTKQVIKDTTAFLLTDAMVDVVTSGTGGAVNFGGMAIAGKTGTTSDNKDVWFAGYTPYYTCTVWAGYDNNTKMSSSKVNNETGIAKVLWRDIMKQVHAELPNTQFSIPQGIVQATVCSRSGKLAIPGICDATLITEYFAEGTVPTEICDVHYEGYVCAYDNLPASADCPFKYLGHLELTPIENEALQVGSTSMIKNEDGSIIYQTPRTSNLCQHDALFFSDPNYEAIIAGQQLELNQRQEVAAAAAAAEAAAANAAVGTDTTQQ